MRPTSYHHNKALQILHTLSDARPDIDQRAQVLTGSEEAKISDACYLLDNIAAAFAFNEKFNASESEFFAAVALLESLVPHEWASAHPQAVKPLDRRYTGLTNAEHQEWLNRPKGPAQTPRTPGNRADRKRAARAARYASDPEFRARCDSFGSSS